MTVAERESPAAPGATPPLEPHPAFNRSLRGYSPDQVDSYLATMRTLLEEAWDRPDGAGGSGRIDELEAIGRDFLG